MFNNLFRKVYRRIRILFVEIDSYIMGNASKHETSIQRFRYDKPGKENEGVKEIVRLCRNSRIRSSVHVVRKGAADSLHSHSTVDGFWFVLKGKAIFHGEGETIYGEIYEHEGILIPRNTRYWYESAGTEDLEILQVLAINEYKGWQRNNYEKFHYDRKLVKRIDGKVLEN